MTGNDSIRVLFVQEELDEFSSYRDVLSILRNLEPQIQVVKHATSGKEAISAAKLLQPDIILADWHYDDMGVITLASKLYKEIPALPIIAMASSFSADMMRDGMFNGIDDFLRLPIAKTELLRTLKLVVNRGKMDVEQIRDKYLESKKPISTVIIQHKVSQHLHDQLYEIGPIIQVMCWSSSSEIGIERVEELEPDLVLIETTFSDAAIYSLLEKLGEIRPEMAVVLIGDGMDDFETTNTFHTFLKCPFTAQTLLESIGSVTQINST